MDIDELANRFAYHRPNGDRAVRHQEVRQSMYNAARAINDECPDGREKSLAMTNLELAMFWANAAIARNE